MPATEIGVHLSNHGDVRQSLAVARAADRVGAHTIWISEDLYFHGALPLAAAVAVQTTSSRIGFSVLTPYGTHPARLAMDLATVSALAPGRLIAGLGAGVRERVDHMRAQWHGPVDVVRRTAQAVGSLMDGHTVDSDDPVGPADGLRLSLAEPPGAPPMYVAAMGPRALRQAGRLFDGALLSMMAVEPHIRAAAQLVQRGADQAGRPRPAVIASVPVRVDLDGPAALSRSRALVAHLMQRWATVTSLRRLFTADGHLTEDRFDRIVDRLRSGQAPALAVPAELAIAHCPAGTTAEVADRVRSLAAAGASGVSLDIGDVAEPHAQALLADLFARLGAPAAAAATEPALSGRPGAG